MPQVVGAAAERGAALRLVPGLVIAIEPWFLGGGADECAVDANGWTVRSTDGSRAAHVEHTVTPDGPVVLTAPLQEDPERARLTGPTPADLRR